MSSESSIFSGLEAALREAKGRPDPAPKPPMEFPEFWEPGHFDLRIVDGDHAPVISVTPAARWLDCSACDGEGWVEVSGGWARNCRCQEPPRIADGINRAGMPPGARTRTLGTLDWSIVVGVDRSSGAPTGVAGEEVRESVMAWLGRWDRHADSILLHGPTGVGKTHLAYGIAWHTLLRRPGARVRLISWPRFFGAYAAASKAGCGADVAMMQSVLACDLLIIDELNRTNAWSGQVLEEIIDARIEASQLCTVLTTNLRPGAASGEDAAMVDQVGDRVTSRLRQVWRVELGGADKRGRM